MRESFRGYRPVEVIATMVGEREQESKFDVDDEFALPDFRHVGERSTTKLAATYWDSVDLRLLRWGHTLRYRRASDGSEDGWTLKLGSATRDHSSALERTEIDATGTDESPPDALVARVTGLVRGEPLIMIAHVETDRCTVLVTTGERSDEAVLQVSDDRVRAAPEGGSTVEFRQIEVEALNPRSDRLIAEMHERLIARGAAPTQVSKLERAIGYRPPPEVEIPELDAHPSIDDLARSVFATGARRLLELDADLRIGADEETIHQARVTGRRLRSDLKTLEPLLAAQHVRDMREDLAWLGELLGGVRDLDVLIGRIRDTSERLAPLDRDACVQIVRALERDRDRCHHELLDALGSSRYFDLIDRLLAATQLPPLGVGPRDRPARPILRKLVRKAWRRTHRAVTRLDRSATDAELHEIRKRAKRARYAVELAEPLFGKPSARFADQLTMLQDILGESQDTVVAERALRGLVDRGLGGTPSLVAGLLVCRELDVRQQARERWPVVWKSVRAKRRRHFLSRST